MITNWTLKPFLRVPKLVLQIHVDEYAMGLEQSSNHENLSQKIDT